jgi:hypothetical protein
MLEDISIADLSVILPCSLRALLQAAVTAGAAAQQWDQQKWAAYTRVKPHGYPFPPFSEESYRRLG